MKFTLTGPLDGRSATVTWEDGELTGDDALIAAVDDLVQRGVKVELMVAMGHYRAELHDPYTAEATIREAFDGPPTDLNGEFPYVQPLPPGAISSPLPEATSIYERWAMPTTTVWEPSERPRTESEG